MVLHTYNDLYLPRYQDILPAMKSCLANILVQFAEIGLVAMATNLKI